MAAVTFKGPLFDGSLKRDVLRAIERANSDIGTLGVRYVRDIDDATFRNPTGYARGQVWRRFVPPNVVVIHRSGLIYSHWLEDGGTRSLWFGGYHAFERATPRLAKDATKLVAHHIERVLG